MRSVLFDVDGVLVHSLFHDIPERRRRWDRYLLEDTGVDPEAFQTFFGPAFMEVIEGRVSLVTALEAFLPTVGYHLSPLGFIDYWLARDTHVNLQLMSLLARLRASGPVRLYLATNQEHLRAFHLWDKVGLKHHFDDMFYAARMGVAKPDPEFFRRVEARIGPQQEPPLFFDDSRSVVAAANEFGWEGVVFSDVEDCAGHSWIAGRLGTVMAGQT
ncbi:HAD family hydrolase [Mesorhizobium sp. L-8-3]|uniref:HAD family hydrolase n=1 Tax=Mesorhizobium sp. L-8-3 TaxID=2744522 RepID=UPI0019263EB7|nr:HAD-IA family hydrolase [Mesorhizobium sp. L-8-3]BCH25553.1 haloacid dehalogenase [Mesorhizobium sp. L-8-3]